MPNINTGFKTNRIFFAFIDISTAFFSLFFGWMLAVSFLGSTLSARMSEFQFSPSQSMTSLTILSQFAGLALTGLIVKNRSGVRKTIFPAFFISIAGTIVFLFPPSFLWNISMIILPFTGGAVVACWGSYYQRCENTSARIRVAANIIIISNIGMIMLNVIAVNLSAFMGILLSIAMLTGALLLCIRDQRPQFSQRSQFNDHPQFSHQPPFKHTPLFFRSMILLYVFVTIITIDSGLMYMVVNPYFAHHEMLTSLYWAVPYIGAIYAMKRLPERINKSYVMYIAVAMIGFAYILFFILDNSALSYIIIDTLMLGAFGICDLFWWVILGEMLAFTNNPVRFFGLGLSANILGVFLGGMIGNYIHESLAGRIDATTAAIGVVLISLLSLPILYDNLSRLIKNQAFLVGLIIKKDENKAPETVENEKTIDSTDPLEAEGLSIFGFTGREIEIAQLLLRGRTYKMIAQELFISENTVKTHIKNIYSKMNVVNKTEFLEMIKITQNQ